MVDFVGDSADNIFTGGTDNDTADGNGGDDTLRGNDGHDSLAGGDGSDTIFGGNGNDTIYGGERSETWSTFDRDAIADTLYGGDGDDRIFAGYNDTVYGGTQGNYGDTLYISFQGATEGISVDFNQDEIANGSGTISGIEAIGWAEGSNFDDTIRMDSSSRGFAQAYGMDGNDTLIGGYYTGSMYGGDGDDLIDATASIYGYDLFGGAGDDVIYDHRNGSNMFGGDGNDILYGHRAMYGEAGDDTLYVEQSSYTGTISGGDGNDRIVIRSTRNVGSVFGDDGADVIRGYTGAETLFGGQGWDRLFGEEGNDYLYSAGYRMEGSRQLVTEDRGVEIDKLMGGAGDDYLSIGIGDYADGGEGFDKLSLSLGGAKEGVSLTTFGITSGSWTFAGTTVLNVEALVSLTGSAFDDSFVIATQDYNVDIDGGDGNDLVESRGSSVYFEGGAGDDTLLSGIAGDYFDGGEGSDTISYFNYAVAVTVDLSTGTGAGGDSLISVENVRGSAYADTITGNLADNVIFGFGGDDVIYSGAGNDSVFGGGGNDELVTGSGIDYLYGQAGDDFLRVNGFNVTDEAYVTGGAGNDVLAHSGGFGRLVADMGDGDDEVAILDGISEGAWIVLGAGRDVIGIGNEGNENILVSDFVTGDAGDEVKLNGWGLSSDPFATGQYWLEQDGNSTVLKFDADGDGIGGKVLMKFLGTDATSFTAANFGGFNPVVQEPTGGTEDADTLIGTDEADQIAGRGGDDIIFGRGGNDEISGNEGDDQLFGEAGNDNLFGDAGRDLIDGGDGDDFLSGGGLDDTLIGGLGADTLFGDRGNDTIYGGEGDDNVFGGEGNDTLSGGLGTNIIDGGNGIDTVSYRNFEAGVFVQLGYPTNTGSSIDYFTSIENIEGSNFDDTLYGDDNVNVINGGGGNDFIVSLGSNGGSDTLVGGDGDDALIVNNGGAATMVGGEGDDYMRGGSLVDTYYGGAGTDRVSFFLSDATQAVIVDLRTQIITNDGYGNTEQMFGVESLGGGTQFADEFYGNNLDNLIIGGTDDIIFGFGGDDEIVLGGAGAVVDGGDGNDTLSIASSQLGPDNNFDGRADVVRSTRGAIIDLAAGEILEDGFGSSGTFTSIENLTGWTFDDILFGDANANRIDGHEGNDILYGRDGDDELIGGLGSDELAGGAGNDLLDGGDGTDLANYASATAGVQVALWQDAAQDTVGAGVDTLIGIEHLIGTAFADQLVGDEFSNFLTGGDGDDLLKGLEGDDALAGGEGNDELVGGIGEDFLLGEAGNDVLIGAAGDDQLFGEDGDDYLQGGDGSDLIYADAGNDIILAGASNDTIYAGGNNDYIDGGDGNDVLAGGWGVDTLVGGAGADRFQFRSNHSGSTENAADRILDFSQAEGDIIDLSAIDAIVGGTDDAFTFISDAAFSGTAGELRVYAGETGLFVAGDVDGDGNADFIIAVDGVTDLTAADFLL